MASQRRTTSYRSGRRENDVSSYRDRSVGRRGQQDYLYGNAAPAYQEEYDPEEERSRKRLADERRRQELREEEALRIREEQNQEKAAAGRSAQVVAAVFMLLLLTVSIVYYVELMSKVAVSENHISSLETKIESLKTQNDQRLEEINSSINLEEIKEIAINELGMKYADSSQIVTYSSGTDEYVHQVQEAGN